MVASSRAPHDTLSRVAFLPAWFRRPSELNPGLPGTRSAVGNPILSAGDAPRSPEGPVSLSDPGIRVQSPLSLCQNGFLARHPVPPSLSGDSPLARSDHE